MFFFLEDFVSCAKDNDGEKEEVDADNTPGISTTASVTWYRDEDISSQLVPDKHFRDSDSNLPTLVLGGWHSSMKYCVHTNKHTGI